MFSKISKMEILKNITSRHLVFTSRDNKASNISPDRRRVLNRSNALTSRSSVHGWLATIAKPKTKEEFQPNVNGMRLVSNECAGLSRTETGWEPESKTGKCKGKWRKEQIRSVPRPWLVIFTRRPRRARAPPETQT